MIQHRALEDYRHACLGVLDLKPLRITFKMLGPRMGYDPLHLDGVLAWCAVEYATNGQGVPDFADPYDIPLPLACLWHDPHSGLPLWASTDFEPGGKVRRATLHWHKRAPRPELVTKSAGHPWNIRLTKGTYKELRLPLPGELCAEWHADCIGDPIEVANLLRCLGAHVGKKRSQGYGALQAIAMQEVDNFSLFGDAGRPRRPIPLSALVSVVARDTVVDLNLRSGNFLGWTPPYWLPACQGLVAT